MLGKCGLVGCIAVVIVGNGCRPARSPIPVGAGVIATSPRGIGDSFLGVPLDAHFRPLQGEEATTLFPKATVAHFPDDKMAHEFFVVEDSVMLEANLAAWGMVSASAGMGGDSRYASYRAYQIKYVATLDDRTTLRTPPPGAVYYAAKVYYGHSFEALFIGNSRRFHAGVKARFTKGVGASVNAFQSSEKLELRYVGYGLEPKSGDAIFAKSDEDVKEKYQSNGKNPVAIFVEYRPIPGGALPPAANVPWIAPLNAQVTFESLKVYDDGTAGSTPWYARAFCTLNGTEVDLGAKSDAIPPGMRIDAVQTVTSNWSTTFECLPGDVLQCGTRGNYVDTFSSGPLPTASTLPFTVSTTGSWTATTPRAKSNSVDYEINYRIDVR